MPRRETYTEAPDSMGHPLVVGDYVLAYIRDYDRSPGAYNSGSSRRMVKGIVTGFANSDKIRMQIEGDATWNPETSWVSSYYATLIAPRDMVDVYKETLAYFTERNN
ncbi:MAG: hypothetical protein H9W81_12710 [Enterococcus sp.]|nr:hypothetical protein [Enterococcus sp.]